VNLQSLTTQRVRTTDMMTHYFIEFEKYAASVMFL